MNTTLRSLYHRGLSLLPDEVGSRIFEAAFKARGRPRVYRRHLSHLAHLLTRGSVTFSLDFELAWAWRFSKRAASQHVTLGLQERDQVPVILQAFDSFKLPATWATVGHLFLESCERGPGGHAHPEMPPMPAFETRWWKFDGGDWYAHDPCTNATRDPAWYAPDLIAQIQASPTGHEVACHSFSHASFGPHCPHEVALAELSACRSLMRASGAKPDSFVFPANDFGNFDAVAQSGFSIVRYFPDVDAEITLPMRLENGLWATHASYYVQLGSATDPGKLAAHLRFLQMYVDKAVRSRMNAHLWLHPSIQAEQIKLVLVPLLEYCAVLRDKGLLDVLTMRDLVLHTKALPGTAAHEVQQGGGEPVSDGSVPSSSRG